jgi:hypothetical protein
VDKAGSPPSSSEHPRHGVAPASGRSPKECDDLGPEPPEVGLTESPSRQRPIPHTLLLLEEYVGMQQQLLTEYSPVIPPVDHILEVAAEMCPAHLPLGR